MAEDGRPDETAERAVGSSAMTGRHLTLATTATLIGIVAGTLTVVGSVHSYIKTQQDEATRHAQRDAALGQRLDHMEYALRILANESTANRDLVNSLLASSSRQFADYSAASAAHPTSAELPVVKPEHLPAHIAPEIPILAADTPAVERPQ
jgi:hypothetical protein